MPQRAVQTVRTTFNKGLVTEVSELNFPEDASVDELNCDLQLGGNRTKRLGVEYEDFNVLTDETYTEGTLFHTHSWENVGDDPDLQYLVVQTGGKLRFYRKGNPPLSENIVPISNTNSAPFILDMTPYATTSGTGAGGAYVDVASINGVLVVASPNINTFYIERNNNSGTFEVHQISFKVRDFDWLGDPDTRFDQVASPDVSRQYDTKNAGWSETLGDAALTDYLTANSNEYPPLTHPWYSGKNSSGVFSAAEWAKIYSGNSQTANGHYILDLFNPDRDAASGLTGVEYYDGDPVKTPTNTFTTVAAYAGRVFYSGADSRVYFSAIVNNIREIGNLYQLNDPTAEDFSDLLDTDGGWVRIPEAVGIKRLHVFGATLLVFAENGVWRISGVDDVFRASEFAVYKVSDFGLAFLNSFVAGSNNQPFWWSYIGIHSVEVTDNGAMNEVNISRPTIKSFVDAINPSTKDKITSAYDGINNTIYWIYPDNDETIDGKLNNFLLLDVDIGAFYPWKVKDKTSSSTPYIVGTSFFEGAGSDEVTFDVVDSNGNLVIDSMGNQIVATREVGITASSAIKLLVRDPSGSLTIATFSDNTFYDWGDAGYEAYAVSAYNFIGSLGLRKTSPYVTVLVKEDTSYTSGCTLSSYWDFKSTPSTTPQQIYRSDFSPTKTVNTTRMRLRGRGRVVTLRFEGEAGKGFNILGWETLDVSNAGY